jgi:MoaA/NifB/PqqE/SkfB family radical SAM enzyme
VDLPWDAAKAALDVLLAPGPASVEIAFTGGEPFLADALLRLCVLYARAAALPGTRLKLSASTNGLLLDEERARFLAANDFDLQVSWDGEAQEERAPGTSAAVREGIARLAAADPEWFRRRVRVAYTLTPTNLALLPASVEALLRAGLRTIVVHPAWGLEWPPAAELERALDEALAEVARACAPLVRAGAAAPVTLLRPPAVHAWGDDRLCPCAAASPATFAVAPDGSAWGCSTFASPMQRLPAAALPVAEALSLGDVRDPPFRSRLASLPARCAGVKALTHRTTRRSPRGECASCSLLAVCAPCPAAGTRVPGTDDPERLPAADCALARSAARARALLPVPLPGLVRSLVEGTARLEALARGLGR